MPMIKVASQMAVVTALILFISPSLLYIAPALRPDAKLPIGLQLKVVIFSMIGVGAMNSGV